MMDNSADRLFDTSLVARWIVERQFIWQIRFISSNDLCNLARDRGLSYWALNDDIQRLWQSGLLKADLVISQGPLNLGGLSLIDQNDEGEFFYADNRGLILRSEGLGGIMEELEAFPPTISLMFHPSCITSMSGNGRFVIKALA